MRRALFVALIMACLAAVTVPGQAQYKWESAEGGVVYSDLPPPSDARLVQRHGRVVPANVGDTDADLPYEVKSAKAKHPRDAGSTAPDCSPCRSARELLAERGIPFSEKTIRSSADVDASGIGFADAVLPGLGVGRERTGGFESAGWNALLDAAGSRSEPSCRRSIGRPMRSRCRRAPRKSKSSSAIPAAATPRPRPKSGPSTRRRRSSATAGRCRKPPPPSDAPISPRSGSETPRRRGDAVEPARRNVAGR